MSIRYRILTLAACAIVAAPALAADIAVNGGFETGDFSGWDQFESGAGQQTIVSPGASGSFAACIDNSNAPSASVIKNSFLGAGIVFGGASVTISFDARGAGANGGVAFAEFFTEIDGGGVSGSEILGGAPLALDADPNTWKSFSFSTTAGPDASGGLTIQFGAITGAVTGSTMFLCVDNLVVDVDGIVSNGEASWGALKGTFE